MAFCLDQLAACDQIEQRPVSSCGYFIHCRLKDVDLPRAARTGPWLHELLDDVKGTLMASTPQIYAHRVGRMTPIPRCAREHRPKTIDSNILGSGFQIALTMQVRESCRSRSDCRL